MAPKKYSPEDLQIGSLIRDKYTGDLALLLYRSNLFAELTEEEEIWIWSISWSGPTTDSTNRNTPFLEEGILGFLNSGVWEMKGDAAT